MKNTLHLEVSEQEIEQAFAPGVARVVPAHDAEWAAKEKQLKIKMTTGVPWWRKLLRPVAEKRVRDTYEKRWTAEAALSRFTRRPENCDPIVWRDQHYFAYSIWTKRVHLLFLMRLIEKLGAGQCPGNWQRHGAQSLHSRSAISPNKIHRN